MTTPIVSQQFEDLTVANNSADATFDLSTNFDDPSTTGQIATFDFAEDVGVEDIDVLLFDQDGVGAPATIANFIEYIEDGAYDNSIIHRSIPGFIIQGGGFAVENLGIVAIPENDPVENEFSSERSNVRGTIAMAKQDGDPDSATNQWFFNLADNSENLDNQNGGFTVFGEILNDSGLESIDAIAALPIIDARAEDPITQAFQALPVTADIAEVNEDEPVIIDDLVFLDNVSLTSQDELSYSVTNNSNEELVDATIVDGELVLDYAEDQTGEATITVEATNLLGESVEDAFVVTVEEAEEPEPETEIPNEALIGSEVFRFLDPNTGVHFYTDSEEETAELVSSQPDLIPESVAYRTVNPSSESGTEVFTLLNQDTGAFLYTTFEEELDFIEENLDNYTLQEDDSLFAFAEEQEGTIPIYRFLDTDTGAHFYTSSEAERNSIEENLPEYNPEGIAFYAFDAGI